jgi:GT2 family glycosyltransferase
MGEFATPHVGRCEIVIPFYGDPHPLDVCLKSLGPDVSPVVINSNPPHKRKYFTEAVNVGIRQAMSFRHDSTDYAIWVLNADTVVKPDTVANALKVFDEEGWDKTGIVATQCLLARDQDIIVFGGAKQCYPNGAHKNGRVSAGDLRIRTEEDWVSFASVFINARLIRDIGLLDKTLEHVCSDSDYSLRARAAGWKLFYEPTSKVVHQVGSSNHTTDAVLAQVMRRDKDRFKAKWLSGGLFRQLSSYDRNGKPT